MNTKSDPIESVYMTRHQQGLEWAEMEQIYLGEIPWSIAVKIARSQEVETRLCTSKGYGNQGYYFYPEKRTENVS